MRHGSCAAASVHSAIHAVGATRLDEQFSDRGVLIRVELPETSFDSLVRTVRDMSRGRAKVRKSAGKSLRPTTPHNPLP